MQAAADLKVRGYKSRASHHLCSGGEGSDRRERVTTLDAREHCAMEGKSDFLGSKYHQLFRRRLPHQEMNTWN